MAETAHSSIEVFKNILSLKERIEREVLPHFSVRRQDNAQILMRYLYGRPVVSGKDVVQLLDITSNTANGLIDDLIKYGVLTEMTGQRRNRLFMFKEYISLFAR